MEFEIWKALASELIGTFFLVFIGCSAVALSVQSGSGSAGLAGNAFAFGLTYAALIYALNCFSGAHLNPSVSLGYATAGRMNWGLMVGYWVFQVIGAILAALLVAYILGTASGVGASVGSLTHTNAWKAILVEFFITLLLVLVILFVTKQPWLAVAGGLAIGLTLTADMFAAGPLTGASTNPARSLGPAFWNGNFKTYWIYLVGPLVGAIVAGLIFRLLEYRANCCDLRDECGNLVKDECGHQLKECQIPMVDGCGNKMSGDCGKGMMETVVVPDHRAGFMQEYPLHRVGEWMSEHKMSPKYVAQELRHATSSMPMVSY